MTTALVLGLMTAWNAAAVWFFTGWLPVHGDPRNDEQRALRGLAVPRTIDFELTTNDWEGWT